MTKSIVVSLGMDVNHTKICVLSLRNTNSVNLSKPCLSGRPGFKWELSTEFHRDPLSGFLRSRDQ